MEGLQERERREYKEMCERKRRQENEEWMKVAKETRTQEQVWKVINRERRRKVEVNKEIGSEINILKGCWVVQRAKREREERG